MKLGTQSAARKWTARKCQLEVETLEARIAPCAAGWGDGDLCQGDDAPDYPALVAALPIGTPRTTGASTTAAEGLPLPALSSLPGAAATLYLNFTGDSVLSWLGHSSIFIPAFDTDGDGPALSQAEVTTITQIWQIVAENYAPFNINVSTEDPRTLSNYTGTVSQIDIGGDGAWLGGTYGGISQVGGLADSSADNPARGFVFPDNLANGNVWYTGEGISHESGHTMGLNHQSVYSDTTRIAEYQQGPGDGTAPVMGVSYYATRGMWWYGQSSLDSSSYQDDLAVIASNFGYRPAEVGSTASTATPLTVSGTQVRAAGIIATMADVDVWSFTTGTGSISLSVSAPSYGNLHPKIELLDVGGNAITSWQDPDGEKVSWTGTLAAGSYRLVVASHGISSGSTATDYGFDVGTYTITGSTATDPGFEVGTTGITDSTGTLTNIDVGPTQVQVDRPPDGALDGYAGQRQPALAELVLVQATGQRVLLQVGEANPRRRLLGQSTGTHAQRGNPLGDLPLTVPLPPALIQWSAVPAVQPPDF